MDLTNKSIRNVLGIVSIQLMVTFGIVALSYEMKLYYYPNALWMALGAITVCFITLAIPRDVTSRFLFNLKYLGNTTIQEGIVLGTIISKVYAIHEVINAIVICMALVLLLIMLALQTDYDFTPHIMSLHWSLITFLILGFVSAFYTNQAPNIGYSCVGVLIFSLCVIYDIQKVVVGKCITHGEHILATLCLYFGIIGIFGFILDIIKRK